MWEGPVHCGCATPGQVVLSCVRTQTEHTTDKAVSGTLVWPQFRPWLPALTSLSDGLWQSREWG